MQVDLMIRQARSNDAKAISRVIATAVRESNGQDLPNERHRICGGALLAWPVTEQLEKRLVFVALLSDEIVDTGA